MLINGKHTGKPEQKCWGWVWHVFLSDQAAVSYLHTKAGFCCSRHFHEARYNQFNVISGKLLIEEWPCNKLPVLVTTELGPGDSYAVKPGVVHRFTVLEAGQVIEVYWPEVGTSVRQDDIIRLDEGGKVP